jgi:ribosomal protein S18 acetylase RimI-like enzyme
MEAFPRSALSRLGAEAVRRYYEWQFMAPHKAHFLGIFENRRLLGFLLCGLFHEAMGGYLKRNGAWIMKVMLLRPCLILHPEIRTGIRQVLRRLYGSRTSSGNLGASIIPVEKKVFGVLAIAVHPRQQRRGIARSLMMRSELFASEGGFSEIRLTVDPNNHGAKAFYQGLGYHTLVEEDIWKGRMVKKLMHQVPGDIR